MFRPPLLEVFNEKETGFTFPGSTVTVPDFVSEYVMLYELVVPMSRSAVSDTLRQSPAVRGTCNLKSSSYEEAYAIVITSLYPGGVPFS